MANVFRNMIAVFVFAAMPTACSRSSPPTVADQPALVSGHAAEADLQTITLTPEAETRLGIQVKPVERSTVAQTRTLGGDVISPAAGASAMTRYAATASMEPSALATAQVEADGEAARARVARDAARTRHDRIKRLFDAGAESKGNHDDAQEALRTAEASLAMAQSRRALLGQSVGSTNAPSRVWVRAAVYAGDFARLDRKAQAAISSLGGGAPHVGQPLSAPATSNAQTSTTFLFYEVDNRDGAFRMGERVEIAIPTIVEQEGLIVPWSAILYDINGGEWVYERIRQHVYARRRVEMRAVVGDVAVLARGPAEGAEIVSVGAPELFGTEFGVSH